jgi:hypothetical protein
MSNLVFIPANLVDQYVYLVFECVYLEDGIYPEYIFDSAHFKELDANNRLSIIDSKNIFLNPFNKIIYHQLSFDITSKPLFWNPIYNSWTDKGAYISVSIAEIEKSLFN